MSNEGKCIKCGRDDLYLITITKYPDYIEGPYCAKCNPYGELGDMLNDVERSESEAEAEKAAENYAEIHAVRIDGGGYQEAYDFKEQEAAFLAGVEWERKRSAKLLLDATNSFGDKEGGG